MNEKEHNNINESIDSKTIGQESKYQPLSGNPPITLEDAKKEIAEAIEKAKEEFLETAKTEAREEIRNQVQTDKASLITVFGIFASIISFLTIEFQFLRTVCSFEKLIGFTLILASLLLCFNLALDYLVKSRTDYKTPKPNIFFSFFILLLFLSGIAFTFLGNEERCKDNKIYEKYSEDFKNQQVEFSKEYIKEQKSNFDDIEVKIQDIEKRISK